jgi:hypothetical protein
LRTSRERSMRFRRLSAAREREPDSRPFWH